MKKEELKEKLTAFASKSKKISVDIASLIKEKTEDFVNNYKRKSVEASSLSEEKPEPNQETKKEVKKKTLSSLNIYDKKKKDLNSKDMGLSIKPMSVQGQRVAVKRDVFPFFKGLSFASVFSSKNSFSNFTVKVFFLGSAFISAWFLGQSFAQEAVPFAAFVSLFIMGFTIRYIQNVKGALCYGFLTGFFANIFIFDWIFDTVLAGTFNYILAAGSLFGLAFVLAIPMVLFSLFAWQYKHKVWLYPFASACAWVALELIVQLISYKGFGFPWFVLGYTQFANLTLIQISSVLGAYGISFFIVFCSFSASLVLSKGVSFGKRVLNILLICAISFLFTSYGKHQLATVQENTKILKVAILQPNTHNDMLREDDSQILSVLNNIATELEETENLDLVIWPESTIPGYLEEGPLKDFMAKVSTRTKAAQIAGASSRQETKTKHKVKQVNEEDFVSAGLYQKGSLVGRHNKRKLVPFGEFLPFKKQLSNFYKENEISSLTGSFIEGEGPTQVLTIQNDTKKFFFGIQICFESIFPILWRLEVLAGAEFFVNISNDGWFLNTSAPYQHLRINVFRAVENGRPVLRSANSGISAVINSSGEILYSSNLGEKTIGLAELSLSKVPVQTFYTIYGDIFAFLCLFLALMFSYNCLELNRDYD